MNKTAKRRPAGMVITALGMLLIILTVVQSGASFFSPRTVSSGTEAELVGANGGGIYRPFNRAEFVYSTFSGLYLSDDGGRVAVWVMWGVFDEGWVCFYLPADGKDTNGDGMFDENDAPADQWNVEFILRAARPDYHEHSAWVLDESVSESAAYYGTSEGEMSTFFADTVLEAARAGLRWARIAFAAGVLLTLAGGALLLLPEKVRLLPKRFRPDGSDETSGDGDGEAPDGDEDEGEDTDEEYACEDKGEVFGSSAGCACEDEDAEPAADGGDFDSEADGGEPGNPATKAASGTPAPAGMPAKAANTAADGSNDGGSSGDEADDGGFGFEADIGEPDDFGGDASESSPA